MKAYILTVMVVDHEEQGPEVLRATLEDHRYISPRVVDTVQHDIGEWTNKHPLNQPGTDVLGWLREHSTWSKGQA